MVSGVSAAESGATNNVQTATNEPGGIHQVRAGETLSQIAQRYGTDVGTLAALNDIRNPDLIHVGDQLTLPAGAAQGYEVAFGDTLGKIAARHGVGLDALLSANPQIADPNRIFPGDQLSIPANDTAAPATETQQVAPVEGAPRVEGGALALSETDITNIKKTLQTEWVQSAGDAQAHGIIDTILNRTASGHWGDSVSDVVNAYNQFSDINGPIARADGRNAVEDIPESQISTRVDQMVDDYLAERAAGAPSSVGSHLNYANPNYSSPNNLGWINALDGPVLGRGDAVHHHGTVPELDRYRPDDFAVALPGAAAAETAPADQTPVSGSIDGRAAAAANGVHVKSEAVQISRLDAEMEPAIRAVAQAAQRLGLPTPVITSGNDSRHMNGSLHYSDQALDFRGNNISAAQGQAFQDEVRAILGERYDVEFETFANTSNNHLHVEFDPD
ncbi:MAG: hypothetical protein CMN62_09805 [Sphingobium sp.]|nr:hypothetical protein [Sphingobium sp.]